MFAAEESPFATSHACHSERSEESLLRFDLLVGGELASARFSDIV